MINTKYTLLRIFECWQQAAMTKTMTKTLKIILTIFGLLVIGLGSLLVFGFYSMDIEDMYGDNQDIFYNARHGDLVINHDTKDLGQISKTWTRFFVIYQRDTLNINDWWDDKNIE